MKWDYKVQDVDARAVEKALKDFGQEEWEVFGVQPMTGAIVRLFMRKPLEPGTQFIAGG